MSIKVNVGHDANVDGVVHEKCTITFASMTILQVHK